MALILFGMVLAGVVCAAVIIVVMNRADHLGLMQHANHRSSHVRPTPTGGGMGIVAGTTLGGGLICSSDSFLLLILALAALIGLLGLIDDRWPLPAWMRLLVQFGAVSALIVVSGTPGHIVAGGENLWLVLVSACFIVAGVWWVNLFNFLDGIDGYAASEAVFILLAVVGLAMAHGVDLSSFTLFGLMLATSVTLMVFLFFNWPPAKIFMGDVGSTFLGFFLLATAITSASAGWISLWQWAILGVIFTTDATVTLIRRLLRGENITQAHKSHAYQRLARLWGGHKPVTVGLIGTNVLVVFPVAIAAGWDSQFAWIIAVAAYGIAGLGAVMLGAGEEG